MPSISVLLRDEMTRLAKRVVRQEIHKLQAATAAHRERIAAQRRQIAALEKELGLLRKAVAAGRSEALVETGTRNRFSAKGLKSLRNRLALSAEDFGRLVGISGQTIYNWEAKKTAPNEEQVAAIARLRKTGKRELLARLAVQSQDA